MREWEENKQDTRPKVIRVSKNEREQVWPNTTQNDPDGIYAVGDVGPYNSIRGKIVSQRKNT